MVVFDTESHQVPMRRALGERQYFAVAAAAAMAQGDDGVWRATEPRVFYSPEELWTGIASACAPRGETRVWAHNLAHDLSISRAWAILRGMGWESGPRDFAVTAESCWAVWRRGDRRMVLSDSVSFLAGAGLDLIARDLGLERRVLDSTPLELGSLAERCRIDVRVLSGALAELLEWFDQVGAGSLSRTGPGQAMNHYRRRMMPPRSIVAHSCEPALEAERAAAYCGRCEAWQWGDLAGPVDEWDFTLAYPRIAAAEPLPARFSHPIDNPTPSVLARHAAAGYQVLIAGQVDTPEPVVPTRLADGSIAWPTGRFDSVLWDCEADLVARSGGLVTADRAWAYRGDMVLAEWAGWAVDQAMGGAPSPLIARVVKSWSRTLIGRFALRYPTWELYSDSPFVDAYGPDDVALVRSTNDGVDTALLWLGGRVYEQSELVESDSSVPAITSRVSALARVRLWEAMQVAGSEHVAYVDTDSLIVSAEGSRRLMRAQIDGLRHKQRYRGATIYGVRALMLGDVVRAAGLSRKATRTGDRAWSQEVWERWQSEPGRAGSVAVFAHTFTLRQGDGRRRRLAGGRTTAIAVGAADRGEATGS